MEAERTETSSKANKVSLETISTEKAYRWFGAIKTDEEF